MTQYTLLETADDIDQAFPDLVSAQVVGWDKETYGRSKEEALDPLRGKTRLIALATPRTVYLTDTHRTDPRLLLRVWPHIRRLAGHNIAFDGRYGTHIGLPMPNGERLFDTMIASQLLHAGLPAGYLQQSGLAAVARRELGIELDKSLQASDWGGALSGPQYEYAALDADIARRAAEPLECKIHEAGLDVVFAAEMRCLPAIVWMEDTGVPFDAHAWLPLAREAKKERDQLEEALAALDGRLDLFGNGYINWSSPQQVAEALGRRGHKVQSADEAVLAELAARGDDLARLLLRHRALSKQISTYGENWVRHVHPVTGRIHPQWLQLGAAASGRMSCAGGCNVQQIPRDARYRACFRPPEGHVLIKADMGQVELRLAAEIAPDGAMIDAFKRGEDLHIATARNVLGKQDVGKDDRQIAKSLNFGLVYGMSATSLRAYAAQEYGVSLTQGEAETLRRRFFQMYSGLRAWHNSQGEEPVDTRTVLGRRRLNVTRFTEKLNSPVQGSGADCLKLALALLWERRTACPSTVPILAVHDEIVGQVPREDAEQARDWLVRAMQDGMACSLKSVPCEVDAKICADWSGTPVAPPLM